MSRPSSHRTCLVEGCARGCWYAETGLCSTHEQRRRDGVAITDHEHIAAMCALVDAQPIPGFSGFLVSKEGRVYTLNNARGLRRTPLELRAKPDKGGYPRVKLRGTHKSVHRLVALTYLGPCPEGLEVRHLDGRQDNPSLDNLTYGTTKENAADRLRHGTQPFGERHPFARFTDAQVREAVELYLTTPLTQAEVALRFGTSQQVVSGWVACHRLGLHQRSRAGRMKSHGTVASYSGRVAAGRKAT